MTVLAATSSERLGMVSEESSERPTLVDLHETPAVSEPYTHVCYFCEQIATVLYNSVAACSRCALFRWFDYPNLRLNGFGPWGRSLDE